MFNRFDEEKSVQGVWFVMMAMTVYWISLRVIARNTLLPGLGAVVLGRDYLNEREHMMRGKRNREPTSIELNEMSIRFLLNHILLGWENVLDWETGEEIPYTKSAAREMLNEDADFRTWVDARSNESEAYYKERLGNSKPTSKPTSDIRLRYPIKDESELAYLERVEAQMSEHVPALHPPELDYDAVPLSAMFQRLSAARPIGISGGCPIPFADINAYFEVIPPPAWLDIEDVIDVIQACDVIWLKHHYPEDKGTKAPDPPRILAVQ